MVAALGEVLLNTTFQKQELRKQFEPKKSEK